LALSKTVIFKDYQSIPIGNFGGGIIGTPKCSKIRPLAQENKLLTTEVEKYKKELNDKEIVPKKGKEKVNGEEDEEKYSLLTMVFVAIFFYMIGKVIYSKGYFLIPFKRLLI
jgi:hypothetical protein